VLIYQIPKNLPEVGRIVNQRFKMLAPAIHLPDQRAVGKEKPREAAACCTAERYGIQEIIPTLLRVLRKRRPKAVQNHDAVSLPSCMLRFVIL
jgi:hypothetical protein